ncbi:MAG: hypothetical protein IKZ49_01380 [Alphaproteobacteria bacterium]|nr:hypothetical protein [Alphaproteobacteria bacterium]
MIKKIFMLMTGFMFVIGITQMSFAEEVVEEIEIEDQVAAEALNNYNAEGSLFDQITSLEQEKVVMQLEKERAQLDLELERLNAEKMKIQMELETISGRAEQQQQELEAAKAQLEAQTEQLRRKMEQPEEYVEQPRPKQEAGSVSTKYRLLNVIGVGNQLQATIEEVSTGQNKRIAVGKELDGYVVKSISLNDGIIFEKDGVSENLNIGK